MSDEQPEQEQPPDHDDQPDEAKPDAEVTSQSPHRSLSQYTPERLQRMLADVITNRFPIGDVTLLLRAGAAADEPVTRGLRPIHYATYENNVAVIELLTSHGADVNAPDDLGYTPLHIAAKHGHTEAARALLDLGAAVNYGFEDDWPNGGEYSGRSAASNVHTTHESSPAAADSSIIDNNDNDNNNHHHQQQQQQQPTVDTHLTEQPLQLAVENDRTECAELLLQRGADPNYRYFLGRPINLVPLEHIDCLELLLRYGADVDSFSRGGLTALMNAVKQQNMTAVRVLLQHGADVNVQCPPRFDRRRAIHFAAMVGNVSVMRLLLLAGANTSLAPPYSLTPLDCAVVHDRLEICRMLLRYDADPNEVNGDGCSALQLASSTPSLKFQKEIIELLLTSGAQPNFTSPVFSYVGPSLSALVEYLSYSDSFDYGLVRLFLQHGARVSFRLPTRLLKIRHPGGLLGQLRKLRPHDELLCLLVDAADDFDVEALGRDRSLSNRQRTMLIEAAAGPRSLRQQARRAICTSLRSPRGKPAVEQLPLPAYLIQYLLFNVF